MRSPAYDSITVFTIAHYCIIVLHLVYIVVQEWTGF